MLQNFHTHTRYSDGSDEPATYVKEALAQGFSVLGFSDHSPLPFPNSFALKWDQVKNYCKEVTALKQFDPSLTILLGMEVDFIFDSDNPPTIFRQQYPLDYLIGSVHLVQEPGMEERWFIDGPEVKSYDDGLARLFGGDARRGVTAYYRQIQEMINTLQPDIIGHLDKIKMHNKGRFFSEDEPWYQALIDDTLALIRNAGCMVEVNTRGVYKKRSDSLFPGPVVLKKMGQLGIPVVIASDAHKPHELSLHFSKAEHHLKELGFTSRRVFTAGGWSDCSL